MARENDRPAGMDKMQPSNWPKPTQASRPMKNEMGMVAKVASGKVDSGKRMKNPTKGDV